MSETLAIQSHINDTLHFAFINTTVNTSISQCFSIFHLSYLSDLSEGDRQQMHNLLETSPILFRNPYKALRLSEEAGSPGSGWS